MYPEFVFICFFPTPYAYKEPDLVNNRFIFVLIPERNISVCHEDLRTFVNKAVRVTTAYGNWATCCQHAMGEGWKVSMLNKINECNTCYKAMFNQPGRGNK